jgi:hypothetical protein
VRVLSAGSRYDCAVMDSAALRCWGSNSGSALGYPELDGYSVHASGKDNGDVDVF